MYAKHRFSCILNIDFHACSCVIHMNLTDNEFISELKPFTYTKFLHILVCVLSPWLILTFFDVSYLHSLI